jgi:hypothetical protein
LAKALATELSRVFTRWTTTWDVYKLKERRDAAIEADKAAEKEREAQAAAARPPPPKRPTLAERQASRGDKPPFSFTPPPKT